MASDEPGVRQATRDDIHGIVEIGKRFHAASGHGSLVPYCSLSMSQTALRMIESKASAIFVMENGAGLVGVIGMGTIPCFFNSKHLIAGELFWWVDPDYRRGLGPIRLLKAAEHWAKSAGASMVAMASLSRLDAEKLDILYTRMGYSPRENTYVKALPGAGT